MEMKRLTPKEAECLNKSNTLLVDVRENDEFAEIRIENSISVPLSEFAERYQELPLDRELVLVCAAGVRSDRAAQFLAAQGFQVANLEGGIKAWIEADLPVWRKNANS